MKTVDDCATIKPALQPSTLVEVRGASGRLYGLLDPQTLIIQVKRKNEEPELIDLKPLLQVKA